MTLSRTLKCALVGAASLFGLSAHAGPNAYIGDVILTANSFCPRGTAEATGQLLPISSNTALFSLYGTTFGGDGRTTFALPDLRGRAPVHYGTGPGLTPYRLGERFGVEQTTLTVSNLPSHSHALKATTGSSNTDSPDGAALAGASAPNRAVSGATIDSSKSFSGNAVGHTGGSMPLNNLQPILAMRYCVYMQGTYPSRS